MWLFSIDWNFNDQFDWVYFNYEAQQWKKKKHIWESQKSVKNSAKTFDSNSETMSDKSRFWKRCEAMRRTIEELSDCLGTFITKVTKIAQTWGEKIRILKSFCFESLDFLTDFYLNLSRSVMRSFERLKCIVSVCFHPNLNSL